MIKKIVKKVIKILGALTQTDFVVFEGLKLPLARSNQGMSDNKVYFSETKKQLEVAFVGDSCEKKILDFGCGQGRLLNGFIYYNMGFKEYVGVDVDNSSIAWCVRNLTYAQNVSFVWYNQSNARYNKSGNNFPSIPVKDNYFSIIFSNSVFSHLCQEDVEKYARLLRKVAVKDAAFYLTAFIEENVENCAENPEGYMGAKKDNSPLHRVRYNKVYFINVFESVGWELGSYKQNGVSRTGQSELVFRAV